MRWNLMTEFYAIGLSNPRTIETLPNEDMMGFFQAWYENFSLQAEKIKGNRLNEGRSSSEAAEGKEKQGSKRGRWWRARAYNGGLGAEPLDWTRWELCPGQGAKPLGAEKYFAFRRPLEAANLPLFSLYCRLSKLLKFSIRHWQWGIDLRVTWVCVHDLTWHQNDLKVN